MKFSVNNQLFKDIHCDVLITGLFQDENVKDSSLAELNNTLDNLIVSELIERDEFKSKSGQSAVLPTYGKIAPAKIAVLGLGKKEKFNLKEARKAYANAVKLCKKLKVQSVAIDLFNITDLDQDLKDNAQVLAEGFILGSYTFDKYKSKDNNEKPKKEIQDVFIIYKDGSKTDIINNGIETGTIIANATNFSRDLVSEPASTLPPYKLAIIAESIGLACKVYEKQEIEDMEMNTFLAVARGSKEAPKFIHLTYKPEGTPKKKIAIVGKGITFDSGGLDLKTAAGMVDMKMDMSGAAATLGIMKAVKDLKPDVEVIGIVPCCENMPSGNAYKPGDVLRAKNGKTIEVYNTDAEGRLILADALCYAVEQEPDEIIDIATLTGAVIIALGSSCYGLMGNNQELIDRFKKSVEKSGEQTWQLPLLPEFKKLMKSDIADLKNSGSREAGSSYGGMFLKEFVKEIPWIHLDIAGTAWSGKDNNENPKGATGSGVRSVVYYLMDNN